MLIYLLSMCIIEVDFGVDLDSRVALVGPNGAGKSTLLKIMTGELQPLTGSVRPHSRLRFSKFTQHFIDVLDLEMTPLDYFMSLWPDLTRQQCRSFLGRFGVTGSVQTQVMGNLSDGQKSRVVLSKMAKENPHLLLLDEPTNHLDMESIDSLAKAINNFTGGVVLVSHDMRLISQVAKEIWMCDNKTVMRYQGEISDFKMQIQQQLEKDSLIEAGTTKKKSFSTEKGPLFVPLGAPRKYGNEPTKTFTVAPPAAPTAKDFPALEKPKTAEEEILAARLELAELAIKRQRDRQAKEKAGGAVKEMTEEEKSAVAVLKEKEEQEKAEEASREENKKAEAKARKKAEKEKAAAYKAEQDAAIEKRRLEKLADMEAARKMQEDMEIARNERFRLREEKAARERKAEEDRLAEEQAAKDARRAERQRIKREKEEAKQRALQAEKEAWMLEARKDVWTQEQQSALETALLKAPMILESRGAETMAEEKKSRWNFVADAVPGKNRNQCLLRYKLLTQVVHDHKSLQAA